MYRYVPSPIWHSRFVQSLVFLCHTTCNFFRVDSTELIFLVEPNGRAQLQFYKAVWELLCVFWSMDFFCFKWKNNSSMARKLISKITLIILLIEFVKNHLGIIWRIKIKIKFFFSSGWYPSHSSLFLFEVWICATFNISHHSTFHYEGGAEAALRKALRKSIDRGGVMERNSMEGGGGAVCTKTKR